MADYKSCAKHDMDTCPMARRFANNPKVTLDCSKCKDYRSTEKKCGECEDCLFQHSKDCPEVEHDKR